MITLTTELEKRETALTKRMNAYRIEVIRFEDVHDYQSASVATNSANATFEALIEVIRTLNLIKGNK